MYQAVAKSYQGIELLRRLLTLIEWFKSALFEHFVTLFERI